MPIINLTSITTSAAERAAGVVDLPPEMFETVRMLLANAVGADDRGLTDCAHDIAELACHNGLGGDDGDDPWPDAVLIDDMDLRLAVALAGELDIRHIATLCRGCGVLAILVPFDSKEVSHGH